jgi:sulfopropanediol 3-dehydrogenase
MLDPTEVGIVLWARVRKGRTMRISARFATENPDRFRLLKAPAVDAVEAQRDPAVAETVSRMLLDIEANGLDAVRSYAKALDRQDIADGTSFELDASALRATGDQLAPDLREAIELGSERTKAFAALQRQHLADFEAELVPGLVTGQRYVPVGTVGAYPSSMASRPARS